MFEILMRLPLFNGVGHERMAEIVGKSRFHFLKYCADDVVIEAGSPCRHIQFVISGSVRAVIASYDGRIRVKQTIDAPNVVSPDFLFGRATDYPCRVTALSDTSIVQLSKADYVKILGMDQIFLFNCLNLLSMSAQKSVYGIMSLTDGNPARRLAFIVVALTWPGSRDIVLEADLSALSDVAGVDRACLVATLDDMCADGLVDYDNSSVRVKDRRRLAAMLEVKSWNTSEIGHAKGS